MRLALDPKDQVCTRSWCNVRIPATRWSWLGAGLLALAVACGGSGGGHGHDGGTGDGGGGGGNGDGGMVTCLSGLESISLSPADKTVTLDGGPAAPITFTATGHFTGGSTRDIDPAQLAWTATRADDTSPGDIAAGVLAPNPSAGGVVTVSASDTCITGATNVTFFLDTQVGQPDDPGAWGGAGTSTTGAPPIVYPSDQTRFPRNIYRQLFQWRSLGFSQFRLVFNGPSSRVTIYTDGAHPDCAAATPAAGCWEADETSWSFIAASNAGQTVTWTVEALDTSTQPATIRQSAPITIGFSRQDVKGAIFYWSTTSAGVRRANIADAQPENYIAGKPATTYDDGDKVKCVACHVVSRDGKYLVAPVDASSGQSLWVTEVTRDPPPTPLVKQVDNTRGHGFATISPDDSYVVAAWGGLMWQVDRATGTYLGPLPHVVPDGAPDAVMDATQPDWSPDNTQLVYATGKGDAPGKANIAVVPYQGGMTWGTPTTLVATNGTYSNLYPQFSPEGDWIAFSRGKGGHDDNTLQLFVVSSAGGAPVELVAANRVVSNQSTDGQFENAQPTWAPPGDLAWVAFNSKREYGVVAPEGTQQIWVAGIDPTKLGTGDDPSFPAFRLTFQGLNEDNHRAYWTLDVRQEQPPPDAGPTPDAGACVATGDACDPVNDTCCDTGAYCDTADNGVTYTCTIPID